MVSAKDGTGMELMNVQLRMQEEFRAAIAENTHTLLGALDAERKGHREVVQDMLHSMEERDKRHEAATERMLAMVLEHTAPAPAASRPQAAPPAGSSPGPSAAPGPSGAGPSAPARAPVPRTPGAAPSGMGEKYRVYTDGKTHAECIVEKCEAKVCSFKDPSHPARKGKQGAFCVEHHNQLADLKASGIGNEMLSQFPKRAVCPHCHEPVTFKEAKDQGHFLIKFRSGTTDQLLVSKPKSRKNNCGVTHDQAPAKKARIGGCEQA